MIEADRGVAEINFDPGLLPGATDEPVVVSVPPVIADIAAIYRDVEDRYRRIGMLAREARSQTDGNPVPFDFMSIVRPVREPMSARMEVEKNPLIRQWLMLRYFDRLGPWDQSDRPVAEELLSLVWEK